MSLNTSNGTDIVSGSTLPLIPFQSDATYPWPSVVRQLVHYADWGEIMLFNLILLSPVILKTKYSFDGFFFFFCSAEMTHLLLCLSQMFGPLLEAQAAVLVQDPCIQYKIEVRCRRLNGSGYWSDWSKADASSVYSIKGKTLA